MKPALLLFGALAALSVVAAHILAPHHVGPSYYYPPSDIPGVTNSNVTQKNIKQTICVSGWTATIRPTSSYTAALKRRQEFLYHLATSTGEEEDHYISLELGGSPTDPRNLWPEAYPTARDKDRVENALHKAVCTGAMSLAKAQAIITADWYAYFLTLK